MRSPRPLRSCQQGRDLGDYQPRDSTKATNVPFGSVSVLLYSYSYFRCCFLLPPAAAAAARQGDAKGREEEERRGEGWGRTSAWPLTPVCVCVFMWGGV